MTAWAGALYGLLLSCEPGYFREDEIRAGVRVDWGAQPDRSGFEELVARCEASVGMTFAEGASVKFVADPNAHCGIPDEMPVAGCWIPQYDLIVLQPDSRLERTALCHELLHRQLFARDQDPDYAHRLPEWGLLSI